MAEDGKIIYKVDIDDSGVESDAQAAGERAGSAVEKGASKGGTALEQVMTGAARRVGEAFVNMASSAVSGVEQVAQAGVEFNSKMETYETAFSTLLGSGEEAQRVMAQIREDAASTPFDVDSLTQANQALVAAGVDADDARKDVLNLANAIAATGGGSAELSRMSANMQGIRNTGKATAMDIRQFANAGINIYGLLADAMGVTTEEAANMEVSYEDLTRAFEMAAESGGVYENALEKQSQTFNGRISTLKDNATQLAGALTEDLFSMMSGEALPMVMDWVATLLEAADTGGIQGALTAAQDILSTLIDTFIANLPNMMTTGITLLLGLIDGISGAIPTILTTAVRVVSALFQGIIQNLPQILAAGGRLLISLASGILQMIPTLIGQLPQVINAIITTFKTTDWGSIGKNIVDGIWAGFVTFWDGLVANVSSCMNDLVGTVMSIFGIASPSKVFRYIFRQVVAGGEKGLEDEEGDLTQTVRRVYGAVPETAQEAMNIDGAGIGIMGDREQLERNLSYNMTATGRLPDQTITVPLYLDGREVARATAWSMGEQLAWEEI